ncbi:hypothetical protein GGH99_000017 [Coemansia sp. RSA 1285]|nr:hypothetical protein GGH99_000017 [Coemansia sp. RSA 1285]
MESEGTGCSTSTAGSCTLEESRVSSQSPERAQIHPQSAEEPSQAYEEKPVGSMKRSRADIATPLKPGSMEARLQENMEFISTPARAPPAMKRVMRDGSPVSRRASLEQTSPDDICLLPPEQGSGGSLVNATQSLSVTHSGSAISPPRFSLTMDEHGSDMVVDGTETRLPLVLANGDNGNDPEDPFSTSRSSLETHASAATIAPAIPIVASEPFKANTPQKPPQNLEVAVIAEYKEQREPGQEMVADTPFVQSELEHKAEPSEAMELDNCPSTENGNCAQTSDAFAAAAADVINNSESAAEIERSTVFDATAPESAAKIESTSPSSPLKLESLPLPTTGELREGGPFSDDVAMDDMSGNVEEKESSIAEESKSPVVDSSGMLSSLSERFEKPELFTTKILADPELMHAAAVPLPGTPSSDDRMKTPIKSASAKDIGDFVIPTDWLMDPSPSGRRLKQPAESPLKRFSSPDGEHSGNLIPVTPANQKLLDSLEIQWLTPSRVPKYSESEMDAVRAGHADEIARHEELRGKLIKSIEDEYNAQIRAYQELADQTLKETDDMVQKLVGSNEREFAEKLAAEQKKHSEEIARHDEESQIQAAEVLRELENAIAERDEIAKERATDRAMFDECLSNSTKLVDEKDSECMALTRELGKLTIDRQRLQEQLESVNALVESLTSEKNNTQKWAEQLAAENTRLEDLTSALRNDVLVAEERSTKIKGYAEDTLSKANGEISSLHERLSVLQQENSTLKTQSTKSDARAKSLQIQLDSAKRQNEELLVLCNNM